MKHVKGDIFQSGADVILHQVNCQGVMGSGVAKQVREKYPDVFAEYKEICERYKDDKEILLGHALFVQCDDDVWIANLFSQKDFGYDGSCYTSYDALRECLVRVNQRFTGCSVAIPYRMACHRGGGDWDIVSKMIEVTLKDCDVTLYEYIG